MSVTHRSYDPLSNVILFSDGTDWCHPELRFAAREKEAHTVYVIQVANISAEGEFCMVLHECRIFQHYMLDQFGKMEAERMCYLLYNQQSTRAKNYAALRQLLRDSGGPHDESEAVRSRRLVVIPSTYIGEERYLRQSIHDIITTLERDETSVHISHNDLQPKLARDSKISLTGTVSAGSARSVCKSI